MAADRKQKQRFFRYSCVFRHVEAPRPNEAHHGRPTKPSTAGVMSRRDGSCLGAELNRLLYTGSAAARRDGRRGRLAAAERSCSVNSRMKAGGELFFFDIRSQSRQRSSKSNKFLSVIVLFPSTSHSPWFSLSCL